MTDKAIELLEEVKQCCLIEDNFGGIGVSEDVVISIDLFDRICQELERIRYIKQEMEY